MNKIDELKAKKQERDIERRTFNAEVRAADSGDKVTIEGHAAVFNQLSEDLGGFREIIEPGFFDGVMEDDVRSLINHDPNLLLGRTKSGTLELSQDATGLFQRTYPPAVEPDATQYAKDLMVSIKRGDVTQQSFAFTVKSTWAGDPQDGYRWDVLGDMVVRHLLPGGCKRLYDVSPVTYPAYAQTDVSASTRSQFDEFKQSIQRGQAPAPEGEASEWQAPLDDLQRRLELASK
jgi:uncharacterized protein